MSSIATILGTKSVLPYGKYAGELVEDVIRIDRPYIMQLYTRKTVGFTPTARELLHSHNTHDQREEINESY